MSKPEVNLYTEKFFLSPSSSVKFFISGRTEKLS